MKRIVMLACLFSFAALNARKITITNKTGEFTTILLLGENKIILEGGEGALSKDQSLTLNPKGLIKTVIAKQTRSEMFPDPFVGNVFQELEYVFEKSVGKKTKDITLKHDDFKVGKVITE